MKKDLGSNLKSEEDSSYLIKETLNTVNNSLRKSLGPYGSTTIIKDQYNINNTITKDGYTILKHIKFDNEVAFTILEIIKQVSRDLVKTVGDGSTSAIIVANALYKYLTETESDVLDHLPRKSIIDFLDDFEITINEYLKKVSKPVDNNSIIENIATVSNNNDKKLGKLVSKIYEKIGPQGFINLELSPTKEDSYKVIDGYSLNYGYINSVFSNQPDKLTCKLDDCYIMMVNETISDEDMQFLAEMVGTVCMSMKKDLLIIAKGYSTEIRNFFLINKKQNEENLNNICCVEYSFFTQDKKDSFEDLAAYLDASIFDKLNNGYLGKLDNETLNPDDIKKLGRCNKVIVNPKETVLIEGKFSEERIKERKELIRKEKENLKKMATTKDLTKEILAKEKRESELNAKTATIFVGGNSDTEKITRRYLLEDSVYACKSALLNGYVVGGNLIIPLLITKYKDKIFDQLKEYDNLKELTDFDIKTLLNSILYSFIQSFRTVLENKYGEDCEKVDKIIDNCLQNETIYNLKTNEYENVLETKIINSVETDRQIMRSTFSIVGLLATSNQFIGTNTKSTYF